jgi:hypothetical protein
MAPLGGEYLMFGSGGGVAELLSVSPASLVLAAPVATLSDGTQVPGCLEFTVTTRRALDWSTVAYRALDWQR